MVGHSCYRNKQMWTLLSVFICVEEKKFKFKTAFVFSRKTLLKFANWISQNLHKIYFVITFCVSFRRSAGGLVEIPVSLVCEICLHLMFYDFYRLQVIFQCLVKILKWQKTEKNWEKLRKNWVKNWGKTEKNLKGKKIKKGRKLRD